MKDKILLIDGHSILNRAFFGLPDLTNAEGEHTNAVYGFLNILFKILEEEHPQYLTVAFDVSAPTFRHKMYKEYKGTRKPMAAELREQVPLMKEVLAAMGINMIEQAGLEADDIIGTLSRRCELSGWDVCVLSGDKDLLQLATDEVMIRIPKSSKGQTTVENYLADDVRARYMVTPKEFIDGVALMGDPSDNIPGIPGVGEKTATKIIAEYHSIENAHEHAAELKPPRASKAIVEYWDDAQMSKTLATINTDADIRFEPADAKLGDLFTPAAYQIFQRLEFKNLLPRFDLDVQENDVEKSFTVVTDDRMRQSVLAEVSQADFCGFAWDREVGAAFCTDADRTYILPADSEAAYEQLMQEARKALAGTETIAFEIKSLLKEIRLKDSSVCFDTSVAAYLINPLKNDYTCFDVGREYLDLIVDEKEKSAVRLGYTAYILHQTKPLLTDKLKEQEMFFLFTDIEMPLVFSLDTMEKNGVRADKDALKEYSDYLGTQITGLEKDIFAETGEEFNLNSPKQLGVVLFEKMGLPGSKKTKTGYSTAASVLEKLAPEYPVVQKILDYRQVAKLKSTYADGLTNFIQDDGRIHGKFNQTITATGRISSTEPNLQNIPIRMELGRKIRKAFIPEEGFVFMDADYSQIELRILAHYSDDQHLIQAYREHSDIHRITASQVFHVPFDEVTPLQRRNAKAVNFGIVYGISSFGLSQGLSISRKEAAQYIENYFETYPGIKTFLDDQVAFAKEHGYAVTMFHRRRPIPELSSGNFMQRSFGERVAMNSPIQGSAADIMKIAMIKVNNALKDQHLKSRLVLQVHDELLIETHKDEIEQVRSILEEDMGRAVKLKVPLEIDIHVGANWYDAK